MQSYDAWQNQVTLADHSEKVKKFDHAEKAWLFALRVAHSEKNNDLVAYTLQRLARCVWAQEKLKEAEQYYLDALNMSQNPELLASAAHDLAKLYYSINKQDFSLQYYQYALQAKTTIYGASDDRVTNLNDEMIQVMNSFVTETETPATECQPVTLSAADKILEDWRGYLESAELNHREGQYEASEEQWQKALDIAELCGRESEIYYQTLERVANLMLEQGREKEAEKLMLDSYSLKVSLLKPNDVEIGKLAQSLAIMYFNQKELDRAEPWAKRAFHVYESQNRDSEELACALHNLAVLYHSKADYAKAEPYYLKGLELKNRVFGQNHLETINLMRGYAELLNNTGRFEEGKRLEQLASGVLSGSYATQPCAELKEEYIPA